MITLPLAVPFVLAAAPAAVDPAVERLFHALAKRDLPTVQSVLEADPKLAGAKGPATRHMPRGGASAVLTAALASSKDGFQPPAENAVLQALLAKKPALDFFDACVSGQDQAVAEQLGRDPKLARAWHPLGWSALHFGGFSGNPKVVDLLLANGAAADLNARAKTRFRNTPLQASLLARQEATARVLLENGADPLVRQSHGFTPMHEAALLGRRDLVDLLLSHGAEINSRGDDGRTAVTEALRGGHAELAEYLKSKGGRGGEVTADLAAPPKE
jgi:ankyrin repeat protein